MEAQVKVGDAVTLKELEPGDLVFTEPGKNGPNHVGLYIGNGMLQESPHTGDVTR
jgi:cell wall-associated NlpC family hydrolase